MSLSKTDSRARFGALDGPGVNEILASVARAIASAQGKPGVCERVRDAILDKGVFAAVWVSEVDRGGQIIAPCTASAAAPRPPDELVTSVIRDGGQHVVVHDTAAVPVLIGASCVAVMVVQAHTPEDFDPSVLALLQQIAALIALALSAGLAGEGTALPDNRPTLDVEAFRAATEALFEGVALLAPIRSSTGEVIDFRYDYANDAYCRLAGIEAGRLLGRRLAELFPGFEATEPFAVYSRVADTRTPVRRNDVRVTPEWQWLPFINGVFDTVIVPMGHHVAVAAQDVTQRVRVEEEMRLRAELLDLAHEAVIIRDPHDSRVQFWNREAEHVYGYTRGEALGQVAHELLATEFPASREVLDDALERTGQWAGVLRHRRKDGQTIIVSSRKALQRDRHDRPIAVIELNSDITEQVRIERGLREQTGRAEKANRAKSEFMSRMSHELRTPLNAISGFGQLLQMADLGQDQTESVQYVLTAADHLLALINDLLDISRVEAGQIRISPEPVLLATTVHEAVSLTQPLAAAGGVAIKADLGALGRTVHVHADPQRLKQVLLNVLSNAIKYNHHGGRVTITATTTTRGARVSITDTGIGIDPHDMLRLFQPFERLGAESTAIEGTGLGLALSKALLELMGGTISATSQRGRGSEFTIDLLAAEAPRGQPLPVVRKRLPEHDAHNTPIRARILYIEDNPLNLRLIERIFARHHQWSIDLLAATEGLVGLEMARERLPDVIMLDLHLPDIPGEDLLRHLKADPETAPIPVLILTADATPGLESRLKGLGGAALLTKPLDVQRLIDTLSDWLATPPEPAD